MSITNPSIQFLRGTSTAKSNNSTKVLAAGQPFYDTTNKKLYICDGSTTLGNLTAIGGDNAEYTLTKSGSNIYLKKDGTTVSTITDDVGSGTDTNYYHTPSYSSGLQIATGYYIVKSISIEEYDDTYYIANLDGEPLLYIPREDNYEIAPGHTYDIVFA